MRRLLESQLRLINTALFWNELGSGDAPRGTSALIRGAGSEALLAEATRVYQGD